MADLKQAASLARDPTFIQRVDQALAIAAIAVANEAIGDVQTLTITGSPTSGGLTLTWNAQTTGTIAWNASAGQVQQAFQALTNVGVGNVACTGGPLPGTPVTFTFTGTLGNAAQNTITIGVNALGGGVSPTPTITHTTVGASVAGHTMAAAYARIVLGDNTGLYAALFAKSTANNATVFADFVLSGSIWVPAGGVTEATIANDIQFVVNGNFRAYSG